MQVLTIDPEFKQLIPPLSELEYQQLEANLLADGCRDPLVVWNGILIDGHNRYEICTRHDLPFDTVAMDFGGRGEAIEWIVRNQLGRRNLLPAARVELTKHLEPIFEERAKANQAIFAGNQYTGGLRANLHEVHKPLRTREELAKIAGMSENTYRKIETVLDSGNQKLASDLRAGMVSPDAAFKEAKRTEQKEAYQQAKAESYKPLASLVEVLHGDMLAIVAV